MQLVEVTNTLLQKRFLQVHADINKTNANWIQPLNQDINAAFDPDKNKLFNSGQVNRWLLRSNSGQYIGRIAAFINPKYSNKGDHIPIGGIGYFDCINDQHAANRLFETAKQWLKDQGMQAMDGPINFGERHTRWGLLVEGFQPPVYGLNYNPPFYQSLFEGYGFQKFYSQYCYDLPINQDNPKQLTDKFYKAHASYAGDPNYYIRHVTKSNIREFARDFSVVYNKAWAGHEGNKSLSEQAAVKMFSQMKPVIRKHTAWIAYSNDTPVATWINMINLNEIFRHFNGRFGLIEKLNFLYRINFQKLTQLVGLVYGVIPEFQGSGIDYFMIVEAEKELKTKTNFNHLELQWIGDFNPKMNAIAGFLEAEKSRELITYRYLFDKETKFERHPILG